MKRNSAISTFDSTAAIDLARRACLAPGVIFFPLMCRTLVRRPPHLLDLLLYGPAIKAISKPLYFLYLNASSTVSKNKLTWYNLQLIFSDCLDYMRYILHVPDCLISHHCTITCAYLIYRQKVWWVSNWRVGSTTP